MPCPRDVGQRTALTWIVKAPADGKPYAVRVKVGGRTIEGWRPGLDGWRPQIMPLRLLNNAEWRFRVRKTDNDDLDVPIVDRESTSVCKPNGDDECGLAAPPDDEPLIPPLKPLFWTAPGTYDVVVTALGRQPDGTFTELCKVTRTYELGVLNDSDPNRQAVDFYVNGGLFPHFTSGMDTQLHLTWHTARDKEHYFMGEDWLAFHRMLVKSFDDWRTLFGYPTVTPYDGSGPVPTEDGGFSMVDFTRPKTLSGTYRPDCYKNDTSCPPQPWFTVLGDGVRARGNDLLDGKCYYAPDRNGVVEEVPTGQRQLGDFKDARGLGCVLNRTHHGLMHASNQGAFHFIATTPRDPLFWAYHKWASGYGPGYVPLGRTRATTPSTESVLTAWERVKAQGPPGITAVFPPKGIAVSQLPGIQVLFWEPVTGVAASDLTVNGSPATTVVGTGSEYVFSGFAVPPQPPAGGSVPLAIELAAGAIKDAQATAFPGDGWQFLLEHDQDGDAMPDGQDNCPDVANPNQENTDTLIGATFDAHGDHGYGNGLGDDLGDACDPDDDGDTIPDDIEIANGSDPRDWRSPDPCPLDPQKTDPGACGCGVRDVVVGTDVTCVLGPVCVGSPSATSTHQGVHRAQPPDCHDGDPCTTDACAEPTGCVNTAPLGYDLFTCRVDQLQRPAPCGADQLKGGIGGQLAKKARAALKTAQKAQVATKAKKRAKLLKSVDAQLRGVTPRIAKALKKKQITAACRTTLDGLVAAARAAIPGS